MKKEKQYWVNIICDKNENPYLVIVTDGETVEEIPVHNTNLKRLKNQMRSMYRPVDMFISIMLGEE